METELEPESSAELEKSLILKGLNPSQVSAVTHGDGPALILAGAGSGKTRVITHRIAYLIREQEVSPANILAVTFTNKAAREMKERVFEILKGEARGIWVTTFHSMGAKILRRHAQKIGFNENYSIYGTSAQKSLVKRIISELNLDSKRFTPVYVLDQISKWKGDWKGPETLDSRSEDARIIQVYEKYQESLQKSNAMDFDDLLFLLVRLFTQNISVLEDFQEQFHHMMVDEFQDTNAIQYHLIRTLSEKHSNVCVVGDEDQAIYSWRGARIQYILDFDKHFAQPNQPVRRFELNTNYRCPRPCLEAANQLIRNNQQRTQDKARLVSAKGGEGYIPYSLSDHYLDEARQVLKEIERLRSEGQGYGSMTLLYRTHAQSRVFEQELIREGVPYRIYGSALFFERKEILDCLAYLAILHNPFDSESFLRILNVPARGLGKRSVEKLLNFAANHSIPPLLALEAVDTVGNAVRERFLAFYNFFVSLKEELDKGAKIHVLLSKIIEETGYMQHLKDRDEEDRCANVEELLSMVVEYEEEEDQATLEGFLEKTSLLSPIDDFEKDLGTVTLMTLHNAKGLEFDHVFMVGMEEGLFPHKNSQEDAERLEEERRLCYVGITRTMKELFFSGARMRLIHGETHYQIPSRFLREIGDTFLVRV
jgi:DNA helicase II / ATP-dependent DNA helicase PcrA